MSAVAREPNRSDIDKRVEIRAYSLHDKVAIFCGRLASFSIRDERRTAGSARVLTWRFKDDPAEYQVNLNAEVVAGQVPITVDVL